MQRKGTLGRSLRPAGHLPGAQAWHVEPNTHANGGLHNAMQSVRAQLRARVNVGTLGTATDGFNDVTRAEVDARLRDEYEAVPVWIPDAEFGKCYDEFCHQVGSGVLLMDVC
jgi:trehalose-6-phosphate synthase